MRGGGGGAVTDVCMCKIGYNAYIPFLLYYYCIAM